MKLLVTIALLCGIAHAADVYITQATSGGDTGVNCANAHSASWFNSNATGGNTYHLCGTFTGLTGTTMLTVPASGSNGSPLIILFEAGAIMQSQRWVAGTFLGDGTPGGAIAIVSKDYVIIDGGTNGIIQNTDNGTVNTATCLSGTGTGGKCGTAATSFGIYAKGNNLIIRNLNIRDIYNVSGADTASLAQVTADVYVDSPATNVSVCNNTLNNSNIGLISYATGSGSQNNDCQSNTAASGINVFLNTLDDHAWQMAFVPSAAAAPNVYAHQIGTDAGWAAAPSASAWHTDGIITFPTNSSVAATMYIYNNLFYGALADGVAGHGSPTGFVFCSYGAGYTGSGAVCNIFNNVIVSTLTNGGAAGVWLGGDSGYVVGPHKIYNNTIIDHQWAITATNSAATANWYTVKNNIIQSVQSGGRFLFDSGTTDAFSMLNFNTNTYYNVAQQSWVWNGFHNSFSAWKTDCSNGGGTGCDAAGSYGDAGLDVNYKIGSSSNAHGIGENLTSLCSGQMAPLCSDKPPTIGQGGSLGGNNARPSSGAWDAGAYQYVPMGNFTGNMFIKGSVVAQ